jgi:hypothetical protein
MKLSAFFYLFLTLKCFVTMLAMFATCRSATPNQWDFFTFGRVYFLSEESDTSNVFKMSSELCRVCRAPAATLINNNEILPITCDASESEMHEAFRVNPSTRSAQRGPEVTFALFKQLLCTSKSTQNAVHQLVKDNQHIVIVDLHVHAGDHAVASLMLLAEGYNVRHVTCLGQFAPAFF